jgi:hypothetical protein
VHKHISMTEPGESSLPSNFCLPLHDHVIPITIAIGNTGLRTPINLLTKNQASIHHTNEGKTIKAGASAEG